MKAACSSEMWLPIYQTIGCHKPEDTIRKITIEKISKHISASLTERTAIANALHHNKIYYNERYYSVLVIK
jgi:hypothetical protein